MQSTDTVRGNTAVVTIQRHISCLTPVFPGSPDNIAVWCCHHGVRRLAEGGFVSSGQLLAGISRPSTGWNIAGIHTGAARSDGCRLVWSKSGVYSLRPGGDRQPGDRYLAFVGFMTGYPTRLGESWQIHLASIGNHEIFPPPRLFPPSPHAIKPRDHSRSYRTFVGFCLERIRIL